MLNPKISKLLNEQINKELHSSYIYLDIANYYYANNLNGFGNWFDIQVKEENDHANFIIEYLRSNGDKITLTPIEGPNFDFKDFKAPLEAVLEHEKYITDSIHTIYGEALNEHDFRTTQFLDWFVKEQREEEENSDELCQRFELFGRDPKGLYSLDNEMKQRTYTQPTLVV